MLLFDATDGIAHGPAIAKRSRRFFSVLDCTYDNIADRVAELVRRAMTQQSTAKQSVAKPPIAKPIGPDDDLRACGLSSLSLVNLMLSVETDFDLKIPERDMTPANFRSIACIVDLVRALSPQAVTNE
jgi:acyl carrier protein